jgi:HK97 family phage portal protein
VRDWVETKALKDLFTWRGLREVVYGEQDIRGLMEQGYNLNSIASACIAMIATSISEAELKVYREIENDEPEEIPDHWLKNLIRYPNDYISEFELWELTAIYAFAGGSANWLLLNSNAEGIEQGIAPDSIVFLRPDLLTIKERDNMGNPLLYEYRPEGSAEVIHYPAHQVVRFAMMNPLDHTEGLSPLVRVVRELGIDNKASDFTKAFFENGAILAGILSTEQEVDSTTADAIEKRWWQKFGFGSKGVGKTAVLGKGVKYQQLALNFKDMEFESVRSFVETRICSVLGVDPVLLPSWVGIKHGGKYSNYAEARRHLWQETLIPFLRRIESKLNSQLLVYEDGVYCKFDLSHIAALQENEKEKWERIITAFEKGVIKLGQAQHLLGVEIDEEKKDKYSFELTPVLPLGMQGNQNGDTPPTKPRNPQGAQQEQGSKAFDNVEGFKAQVMEEQDKYRELVVKKLTDFFIQAKRKLIAITERSEKAAVPIDELERIEGEIRAQSSEMQQELEDSIAEELTAAVIAGLLLAGKLLNRRMNPDVEEVYLFVRNYLPQLSEHIVKQVVGEVIEILEDARVDDMTIGEIRRLIEQTIDEHIDRADLTALTESVRAINSGLAIGYLQAGYFAHTWITIPDGRRCPFCAAMHGKTVAIGEPFVRLDEEVQGVDDNGKIVTMKNTYLTVLVPPLHPRCRCFLIPATSKGGEGVSGV